MALRTDASSQIGTGHLMRCLTLADALREQGARCSCGRALSGRMFEAVSLAGMTSQFCPPQPANVRRRRFAGAPTWLEADWPADAAQVIGALAGERPDWLVIDHYALDAGSGIGAAPARAAPARDRRPWPIVGCM